MRDAVLSSTSASAIRPLLRRVLGWHVRTLVSLKADIDIALVAPAATLKMLRTNVPQQLSLAARSTSRSVTARPAKALNVSVPRRSLCAAGGVSRQIAPGSRRVTTEQNTFLQVKAQAGMSP